MSNAVIYTGDNVEVMRRVIPDESIQLTVTSPPYDNLRKYNGFTWDFESIAKELFRVTKPGGVVVWVVADATVDGSETGTSLKQGLFFKDCGFNLHDTMVYHKDNPCPIGGTNRYFQAWEYMFVFSKGSPKLNAITMQRRNKWNDKRKSRVRCVGRDTNGNFIRKEVPLRTIVKIQNVWTYVVSGGANTPDKEAHKHPAIFPEKLALDHVLSWSNPGDTVLDPFCGSGTTGKMAVQNNRDFIGIEISPEYVSIAAHRIPTAEVKTLE